MLRSMANQNAPSKGRSFKQSKHSNEEFDRLVTLIISTHTHARANQNQINIRLIRWQITSTDTDAKVVYINAMLLEERRTKLTAG